MSWTRQARDLVRSKAGKDLKKLFRFIESKFEELLGEENENGYEDQFPTLYIEYKRAEII